MVCTFFFFFCSHFSDSFIVLYFKVNVKDNVKLRNGKEEVLIVKEYKANGNCDIQYICSCLVHPLL